MRKTKHHTLPKNFRHFQNEFFNGGIRQEARLVTEQDHRAWNTLTRMSQMNLAETAQSLSRFIPSGYKFIVVKVKEVHWIKTWTGDFPSDDNWKCVGCEHQCLHIGTVPPTACVRKEVV